MKKTSVKNLVLVALLSAISFILSFLDFSVPIVPSFIKMDFSDFPALIAAFVFNPLSGVTVEFLKNFLAVFSTSTGGVGEFANFLIGASFVFTAGWIYKFKSTLKGAVIALLCASVVCALFGGVINYFILFPVYSKLFIEMDTIIKMCSEIVPAIDTKFEAIVFTVMPFNFLKGIVLSVLTFITYEKLIPILKRKNR